MKYLGLFATALCMCCTAINALYLLKDRGDEGKEFWGKNHTVMEGDNLTMLCHSQPKAGMKEIIYHWELSERQIGTKYYPIAWLIEQRKRTKKVRATFGVQPAAIPGTRDIKIRNIGRYATGKYTCAVLTLIGRNPKKYYAEYTYQNVFVKCKPKIESKMETKIQLFAGDKLTMDCTSSGYPTPIITWSRVDGRSLRERTTHIKGLLSIHKVGQLEIGEYKCVSANIYGNETKIFSVNIEVPVQILTTSTEKSYAAVGKEGKVRCVSVGFPRPWTTWQWAKRQLTSADGKMGRFEVKDEHFFENSTSYLIIKKVRRVDLREYVCAVANGRDSDFQAFHLYGYSKPDRPKIGLESVVSSTSITIAWKYGESDGGKPVEFVIIEYLQANDTKWQRKIVSEPRLVRHKITNLEPSTTYTFRVTAVNDIGLSKPSAAVKRETTSNRDENDTERPKEDSVDMTVMIAGVAGGFLIVTIAIVIVCILVRNVQRNSARKAAESAERLRKSAKQDITMALFNFLQDGGDRLSTTTSSGGCVSNSGEVLQLTTSNKWEFPRDRLVLQNVLGSGAFGIVMKAEAEGINGYNSRTTSVAVKFVKENESASAKKDLIAELELLKLIEPHKNVINLLGCCTRSEPPMVIVEFCAYGDLQSFLRSSRGIRNQYYLDCYQHPSSRLTSKELLMFGTQISKGMAHLACLKVIHRDLAARNILVDENKVCKVSDFGFARDIFVEDYYKRKTADGRFPIKWMAIESLIDGISTTKSDVWSFGIVLWEIITLGASPYPGMNSQEVVNFLHNGMRMDKPKHCSDELYSLLLDCWQVAAHRRPNFEMLARYLDRMCNDDFEYINMRIYDDHLYINFDGNTLYENSNSVTVMKQDSNEASSKNSKEDNSEESVADV